MKAKRLLKVANMIEMINPEIIDMDEWRSACGTKHCIIGSAAHLGLFKGLELKYGSFENPDLIYTDKEDNQWKNWYAVENLFDIDHHQALFLFGQSLTLTPVEMSSRIRDFVKAGESK